MTRVTERRAAGAAAGLVLGAQTPVTALAQGAVAPVPRGPFEAREQWLLAQNRLSLPSTTPDALASGEASQKTSKGINKIPVSWIYYLIANADGRQMVLVFTVENTLIERLQNRDVNLAFGIDFVPKSPPAK